MQHLRALRAAQKLKREALAKEKEEELISSEGASCSGGCS